MPKKGYKQTEEHKKNVRNSLKDKIFSKERNVKISTSLTGRSFSREHKKHLSESLMGNELTEEVKQRIRISTVEYIKNNNNGIRPRIGKHEKQILDKVQNIIGFSIKRAFYINGYFLDGYCQELNLAIEIDEERHYKNGVLRQKDIEKQNNIMKALNCNFLRIRVKNIVINDSIVMKKLKEKIKSTIETFK